MSKRTSRNLMVAAARAAEMPPDKIAALMAVVDGRQPVAEERAALLTQAQKAHQLGVSRFTVRKLVVSGKLHPLELLPGLLRYRADELVGG